MYKPVPKRMQDHIRKAGKIKQRAYTGWERNADHINTPIKFDYERTLADDDNIGEVISVSRLAEAYIITDHPSKMVVSQLRINDKFGAELQYELFFLQLVLEHTIKLAKEKSVEKLIVKSDVEHIAEVLMELGFGIKSPVVRKTGNQVRTEYEGVKDIE